MAPDRYLLQVTIGRSTQDKLRYAQALLGHAVPSGDLAQVLDRALDALIEQLEKRKFGATTRPRRETVTRAANEARRQATASRAAAEEVISPLRLLGFRAEEARRAAALCEAMPDASLEQRVRRALSYFHPRPRTVAGAATGL